MLNLNMTASEARAYIASRTTIDETTGCHEWQGPRTKDGYGQFNYPIRGIKGVHRLSYHLATGHEYEGRHEQVMHSCHNRCCNNPDHLSLGTAQENMRQAWERGSFANNGGNRAKINADQVREIRKLLAEGLKQKVIGALYGLSVPAVSKIKTGENWSHVV